MFIKNPALRAYLYMIFLALAALAVFYGFLQENAVGLWMGLVSAVLGIGNGLALANVNAPNGKHEAGALPPSDVPPAS